MIRSMTGYGEAHRTLPGGRLRVTIKTVNHRFFNAHLRVSSGFDAQEIQLRKWLREFFTRGHVNCTVAWERGPEAERSELPEIDMERARHYMGLFRSLAEELDLDRAVDLHSVLRFGDVFRVPESGEDETPVEDPVLQEVTEEAARAVLVMREREGAHLKEDLQARLEAMEQELALVEDRAPRRLERERDRLREAIAELAGDEEVDEDRLAREVAYLAERWDIHEEIVRLEAHLQGFREALDDPGPDPVGKRLGFLVQEMHREANTIASKANDPEISGSSVSIREEIERLREQLENVE